MGKMLIIKFNFLLLVRVYTLKLNEKDQKIKLIISIQLKSISNLFTLPKRETCKFDFHLC